MLGSDFQGEQLDKATGMLKAMAHPIRISILHFLKNGEKMTVTQIHERLGIEQSTTSHHLGILKDKGVLCSKRDGKNTFYYLKHIVLGQIIDCMKSCACED
ncbi:MAG: metalloregulator ArsR/SmtB family transcription factor [Prolixibacteraceae bacterium]|jgi:DNA-binding transcriptional ArsR family regulator|nr:metalloregulator ArsR/SmtB family transcription factor [Prolixibacteraceae bacterium]